MTGVVRRLGGAPLTRPVETAEAVDAEERAHRFLENDSAVFHSYHRHLTTGHSISVRHTRIVSTPLQGARPIDILFEFLLSGILDVLFELLSHAFGRDARGRPHPVLGGLGLVALGCMTGGLVTWLLPTRLLGTPAMPGASLAVSPLLNGVLMHYYGLWQRQRRINASFAATFWGGAAFAFGFAVVRFLMLGES